MKCAPIALFVYNRLDHTQRTVEALQKNILASQSKLYIFSDAPKSESQEESVRLVRNYISKIAGFKSTEIIEREFNFGLAKSIIEGVTSIVKLHGHIVVMEDDLVTSPYFLKYMNDALDYYKENDEVMHISAYNFPFNSARLPETFFLKVTTCWGWATWDRAWQHFEKDNTIIEKFDNSMIDQFNFNGAYDYFSHLKFNQQGKWDTWAIFWYASVFLRKGLCLHPSASLVLNIGNDESGVNSIKTDIYDVLITNKQIEKYEDNLVESIDARNRLISYYRESRPSFLKRVINKISKFRKNIK